MKLFRSVLFWTHLTAGVLASVVILVMSFTGVVLALKPQIQNWIERDVRYVTPQDSPRLGAHAAADRGERGEAGGVAAVARPGPRSRGGGHRQPGTRRQRLRQSVHRRHSRHRFGADQPVLPVDDQLAPLHGRDRRVPGDGPIGHRRQQPRVPGAGDHRPVHLVAEAAHAQAPEADRLVPAHVDRAGARFQLAQHDRVLVPDSDRDHDGQRRGDLVPVGEQPGLPR